MMPASSMSDRSALSGIRVVDLCSYVLGPVATQLLGDMGAEVIKVEGPSGDPSRDMGPAREPHMGAIFLGMNRNKRSVMLDLKSPKGRDALLRLADTADVFIHNMRLGTIDRLGVAYEAIAARNPRIIYACAPGYRSDGPYRDRPAFDDIIQGESGLVGMQYLASGSMRYLPTAICDKTVGYALAMAVTAALFHRERTGEGQYVEVPMLETMLSFNLHEHLAGGAFDEPRGEIGYNRYLGSERRPFETRDGLFICVLAHSNQQWRQLCIALERPDLAEHPRFAVLTQRSRHSDEVAAAVAEVIKTRSYADWRARLDAAGIPNGPIRMLADLRNDPELEHCFVRYEHPSIGPMITSSIPIRFSRSPARIRLPQPALGEHSREVLAALGYDEAEIAELLSCGESAAIRAGNSGD